MTLLGSETKGKTERELLSQELKKIRECKEWYKLADYLNLDLDLSHQVDPDGHIHTNTLTLLQNDPILLRKPDYIPTKTSWVIPSNSETYDVLGAFQKFIEIDWQQSVNYQIGDVIYIYCAKPYQRIMFQSEVRRVNIPFMDTIDDREFWISSSKLEEA